MLLNAVLNSIPIFYLSFMKMPSTVWRKIVKVQREFLWGGVGGGRKINWVKWSLVCKPKMEGGLGVLDVRAVNLSLLVNWKWRLLADREVLWKEVLKEKYGSSIGEMVVGEEHALPSFASKWWRDLVRLDGSNWFNTEITRRVRNGMNMSF